MTRLYDDYEARLESYREQAGDFYSGDRRFKFYNAKAKALEREYFHSVVAMRIGDVVTALPIEAHSPRRRAVYFLFAPVCQRVKIGQTQYVEKRFRSLNQGSPEKLEFLGWIPGGEAIEKGIHENLKAHRAYGEWFSVSEDVREELGRFGIAID